ncbi:hypothetical protein Dimus_006770 [Dionaea muscipula]
MGKSKRKHSDDADNSPSSSPELSQSPSSSGDEEGTVEPTSRRRSSKRRASRGDDDERRSSRRREKDRRRKNKYSKRKEKRERERRDDGERKRRKDGERRQRREYKRRVSESDEESESGSAGDDHLRDDKSRVSPEIVARDLLKEYPGVACDLKQLLQMIDNGQAVDIKGISEKLLIRHLKKLFLSLKLKENGDGVFLLRSNARPTLEIVGPLLSSQIVSSAQQFDETPPVTDEMNGEKVKDDNNFVAANDDAPVPRRRVIGPEMPSAELLAAAAKLTEAQAELRDAELEQDDGLFIGPAPPAVVAEAESSNEAERFEEIARIMGNEDDSPYDILGVNHKMSIDNVKKRYAEVHTLLFVQ